MTKLPADTALLLMSDHGFGPIEWYVNFNVWLLEQGFIALQDSFYVKQKHWFYRRGVTPEWIYNVMSRLGLASHRVSRFRGKQSSLLDRLGESVFLSRRHIDWSRTRAYRAGQFRPDLHQSERAASPADASSPPTLGHCDATSRPACWRSSIPRRASRWSSGSTRGRSSTTARMPTLPPTSPWSSMTGATAPSGCTTSRRTRSFPRRSARPATTAWKAS